MSDGDRRSAERKVGWARLWARAKQIVTTDPTGSDEDDQVVDEEAARVLAVQAGKLKGGLAKVAQLAAYDPGATLGGRSGATQAARTVLGGLWDKAPAMSAAAIGKVVEEDLGKPPQVLFAHWDPMSLAAASIGQVHAATLHDGTEVVVKVQYPGVADALRADLDDAGFVRRLAGSNIGHSLELDALRALGEAVRGELDYRAEAAAQDRFTAAWAGHRVLRFPRTVHELSSARVLTMTRARGKTMVDVAASGSPALRRRAAGAIYEFAWGSPLVHRLLNADPNPGNFLVDPGSGEGDATVWCLDFGCSLELPEAVRDADREIWWGLLDDDSEKAAERFRMGLARSGVLLRTDRLATDAHRAWERALMRPLATHDFHWTPAYARELAETTGRVLHAGGVGLPARLLLLWRQRLGAAAVIGMLDAHAPFRTLLLELIGTGRKALR
ncbi:MAG: AarF/ABC1/UbiB kinase family protein [Deltaproteobacteria bacterium]|nr:AarF/ABC1/UbiB kinase family protein [Deltaproteobacteria bacterium]